MTNLLTALTALSQSWFIGAVFVLALGAILVVVCLDNNDEDQ